MTILVSFHSSFHIHFLHSPFLLPFVETKAWFETEEWRDECQRWKLKLQQEQVFGESEGFDPSIHDLTEDGTIIKRDDID